MSDWINYQEWLTQKRWYDEIEQSIPELHEKITKHVNNIIIEMSKRNKKPIVAPHRPVEDLIKAVMDLYKPNKIQKFFMKNFSSLGGEWSQKVSKILFPSVFFVVALAIVYGILGLEQASAALGTTAALVMVPLVGGIIYNETTNRKRVKLIANILSKSVVEVKELEKKYYLA